MSHIESFLSVEDRLAYLMDIAGVSTLSRLAERSGIPVKTLRGLIKRDAIGPKTAERLSESLKVSYKWIKDGAGQPRTDPAAVAPEIAENGLSHPQFPATCVILDPWTAGEHMIDGFDDQGGDEKSSVRVRLKAVAEAFNMNGPLELAMAAGLSAELLGEILTKDQIDDDTAQFVAKRLGIEYEWLRHGMGPMQKPGAEIEGYRGEPTDQAAEKLTPPTRQKKREVRVRGDRPGFSMVPKAKSKLSAGGGIIPEEGTTGEEYAFRLDWLHHVATSPNQVILVDVDGDSMAPTLLDKDTVLIDLGRKELRDGRIYAIAVGDVVNIKRLQRLTGDRIRIISDNPTYYTYEARPDELRIIGQMIWFGRTVV